MVPAVVSGTEGGLWGWERGRADADGGVFCRCVETEGAEEEYDQLSSLETVSEDLGAAETEVRCAGGGGWEGRMYMYDGFTERKERMCMMEDRASWDVGCNVFPRRALRGLRRVTAFGNIVPSLQLLLYFAAGGTQVEMLK